MKKCYYCAKEISYHDMYCSKECEEEYTAYFRKRTKLQKLLSSVNITGTFLIAIGIFLYALNNFVGALAVAVGCLAVGLITLFLPTPTDNFIEKFKLKKAVSIIRKFGIVLIVVGIGALVLAFFKF